MARLVRWMGAVTLGVLVGAFGSFLLRTPPPLPDAQNSSHSGLVTTAAPASTSATSATATTTPAQVAAAPPLFLIWTPGGLPAGLGEQVAAVPGVETVSTVRSDLILIDSVYDSTRKAVEEPPEGWFFPVEAAAVDPAFAELAPADWQATIADLLEEDAILTETSAELRGVGVGAVLSGRQAHRVSAVLPDAVLGGAELVMSTTAGEAAGITTPRYLLITFVGERSDLETAVRSFLPPDLPMRIRALGEAPFLRHGDAVLPQALIKETFGEFVIRPTPDGDTEFDPEWVAQNIVTTDFPLIGEARCHAVMAEQLASALAELERSNLGFLIETFDGCFNPRFIAGSSMLSRHAWGAAIDLNYRANPTGQVTVQNPRLVAVMEKWGFTWGGNWLVPDAAHFEWVGLPRP